AMLIELYVAFEIWCRFATEGTQEVALTKAEATELLKECKRALMEVGRSQAVYQTSSDPVDRYLELLNSAVVSGRAYLTSIDGRPPSKVIGGPGPWGWRRAENGDPAFQKEEWRPQGERIGWVHEEGIYLDANAAYKIAQAQAGADAIAVSEPTLRRRLHERK